MKHLTILFCLIFLFSCDKRKDFFTNQNIPSTGYLKLTDPLNSLTSTINGNSVIDTLKLGQSFTFTFQITDENQYLNLKFDGDGELKMDGASFTQNDITRNDKHSFVWTSNLIGDNNFQLIFKDKYGAETIYNYKIIIFKNRIPKISWLIKDIGILSPYEKEIDVSGLDGDDLYGGKIIYYQYIINQDTTLFTGNKMKYIFPGQGLYNISVRAKDNDDEWSDPVIISNYPI